MSQTRMMTRLLDGAITLPSSIYVDIPLPEYPGHTYIVQACPECRLPEKESTCIDSTLGMEVTCIIKCQCGLWYESGG